VAGDEAADQRRSESEELNYTRRRRNEPHAQQLLCTRVLMKLPRVGFEATFVGSNQLPYGRRRWDTSKPPESNKWFAFN